ncbi:MAG: mannose-1-phosphate guanylyltransferase [Phycisphaerae bacterium]|nr:mannose-1-phosphate guanylyltransferase [Phycisphaerae bacterium]
MRYAMIMAGGTGTRLWPMSREARPKQLIPFAGSAWGGKSLLALAAERLDAIVPAAQRYVCTNEAFRPAIRSALPSFADEQILGEPAGRDTLNAVGFTAAILAKRDPNATFAVLTSDHLIQPHDEFARRLEVGFTLVERDASRFVTFGIEPTFPATGYGYVERGDPIDGVHNAFHARRFVEKPDRERAEAYLESGHFSWNSGMFVFHAATVLEAIRWYRPDTADGLARIADEWDTPRRKATLDAIYPTLFKISVDFGLMEPASRDHRLSICVVPMAVQWMDVGSWPTYASTLVPDAHGNRAGAKLHATATHRCLVVSDDPSHVIATIGCEDLIVIHTKDATLVCRADQAEHVKAMAALVPPQYR